MVIRHHHVQWIYFPMTFLLIISPVSRTDYYLTSPYSKTSTLNCRGNTVKRTPRRAKDVSRSCAIMLSTSRAWISRRRKLYIDYDNNYDGGCSVCAFVNRASIFCSRKEKFLPARQVCSSLGETWFERKELGLRKVGNLFRGNPRWSSGVLLRNRRQRWLPCPRAWQPAGAW